jgi:inorganic pyrophosphatase
MNIANISPIKDGLLNVIIETPRNSQNKFIYDPELDLFRLKKTLPMGTVFPFDFGFIPNTLAEDGDPMDVLVFMDQHAYPGCLVECRPHRDSGSNSEREGQYERTERPGSRSFGHVHSVRRHQRTLKS